MAIVKRVAASSTIGILLVLTLANASAAEVVRIDVRQRDDAGTHERVIARVYFAVDPTLPANRGIADLDRAPRNADGKVEFSSDLLFFRPKDARKARGAVFLEVVNRGRDQSLAILSGAQQRDLSPESWNLGDGFLLEQGFTVAFLGWQFDVRPSQGLYVLGADRAGRGPRARQPHRGGALGQRGYPVDLLRVGVGTDEHHVDVPCADGRDAASSSARHLAARERRVLVASRVRGRHGSLRGRLPGKGFARGRPRSRRYP
jgi:hypothetical protein